MTSIPEHITSRADLELIRTQYEAQQKAIRFHLLVCAGAGCVSSGCYAVRDALLAALKEAGISDQVAVKETGCIGTCDLGPSLVVQPDDVLYTKLKPEDMAKIVQQHLVDGQIIERLCYWDKDKEKRIVHLSDIEFFKRQLRLVTGRCGNLPYESLPAYIAADGYFALEKTLNEMSRMDVIEEMKRSGLRGRGGGGFPVGIKWLAGYNAPGDVKYIVCNGDEGDPGAFMDRSLMEGDPHAVIEGM
ncbi:MAG: NAD(P)H-dependent oxidoreductase subunit E, partial [bacterium]